MVGARWTPLFVGTKLIKIIEFNDGVMELNETRLNGSSGSSLKKTIELEFIPIVTLKSQFRETSFKLYYKRKT